MAQSGGGVMDPETLALANSYTNQRFRRRWKGPYGQVLISGHRGNMQVAPENTLSAIHYCFLYGVPGVELDLSTTADGEIVLMHDSSLDRTTNGTGNVSQATLEYIKTLDAGSWYHPDFEGEPVPTWPEVLQTCRNRFHRVYAELKAVQNTSKLYEETLDADMLDVVCFHGFLSKISDLRAIRALDRDAQISLISTGADWDTAVGYAVELQAIVIDVEWSWLKNNVSRIAEAHSLGIRVDVWGIKDTTQFCQAAASGVDGMQVDNPVDAQFLARRGWV